MQEDDATEPLCVTCRACQLLPFDMPFQAFKAAVMRVNKKAQEKFLELGRPAVAEGAMLLMCSECLEDYEALPSSCQGMEGASTSDPWHCLVCVHPEGGRHLAALTQDFVASRVLSQQGEASRTTGKYQRKMVCCASCFSTRLLPKCVYSSSLRIS